jgi:hypothetical protein
MCILSKNTLSELRPLQISRADTVRAQDAMSLLLLADCVFYRDLVVPGKQVCVEV